MEVRETSNPDTSEEGDNGETKAEAEGEETGAGMEAGETSVDGLENVSATTFSGPGTWTTQPGRRGVVAGGRTMAEKL